MLKYKTITDLVKGMKNGDFKEKDLHIEVDNDGTFFGLTNPHDEDELIEIEVKFAEGYRDVCELYQLLFPNADVDWV